MKEIFKFSKIKEAISSIGFKQTSDRPQHLPIFRQLSVSKQYVLFTSLTVASALGSFGLFFQSFNRTSQLDQRIESSTNLKMLSQRVAKNLEKAVMGNDVPYKLVEIDIATLQTFIEKYKNGFADFEKLEPEVIQSVLLPIKEKYDALSPKMQLFVKNKDIVLSLTRESKNMSKSIAEMTKDLNELYILSNQRGVSPVKLMAMQTLQTSLITFGKGMSDAVSSTEVDYKLISDLNADYITIQKMFKYLLDDEPVEDPYIAAQLTRIDVTYGPQFDKVPALLKQITPLLEGKTAALESLSVFDALYYDADKLRDISEEEKAELIKINYYGYVLSGLALLFILLLGFTNLKEIQIRAWQTKKDNDETDQAVISLMQELMPISEGNLKARTTITEHVTGALADRINLMAESLQAAVKNTRETSDKVSSQMAQVKSMIATASELSSNAELTAKRTNEASIAGSNMVNQAAEKMEEARNKMQETSKRVKRLGEVSQSIGLVTDLIEEMTEKTAVLALNTQLKAAESGSDGNSFRVIAEEIRKLSDEAKKSLSTIRNSVQNMQSETNTVMLSIEQTTANVVEGSVLWEKAESDLKLIQEAAKKIEDITLQLNELSGKQVEKAQETENNMTDLNKSISSFNV
jgi:twitching motility protein PilJ